MTVTLLNQWANGIGAIVAPPSAGKQLLGWVGGEQPPADWENWLNQTQIDKINEIAVDYWDITGGGSWDPTSDSFIDFGTYTGSTWPGILILAPPNATCLEMQSSESEILMNLQNIDGYALRVAGDNGLSPVRSPFKLVPLKDIPSAPVEGEVYTIEGTYFGSLNHRGAFTEYTLVQFRTENNDVRIGLSSGISDLDFSSNDVFWRFNGGALNSRSNRGYASNDLSVFFPLNGYIPLGSKINEIEVDLQPGAARASVGTRMSVKYRNLGTTHNSATDDGTANRQFVTLTPSVVMDDDTSDTFIEVTTGTTAFSDTIWGIRVNFDMPYKF
jgi:hypothetical protein